MITLPVAILLALAVPGLAVYSLRVRKHFLEGEPVIYAHIIAMLLAVVIAAVLGVGLLNGWIGVDATVLTTTTSTGFIINSTSDPNVTTTNATTLYSNALQMTPVQEPVFAGIMLLIATVLGILLAYFLIEAVDIAFHPDIDPYEVDEGEE